MSKQNQFKLVLLGTWDSMSETSRGTVADILVLFDCLIGDSAVGKSRHVTFDSFAFKGLDELFPTGLTLAISSLVLRFVKDQFDEYRESTIGGVFITWFPLASTRQRGQASCANKGSVYSRFLDADCIPKRWSDCKV